MRTRGRICFYTPYLYPVTTPGEIELAGGMEVRHWALARDLASRGFEVLIATCDFGQRGVVVRDGVTLLPTYSTEAGIRGLRFVYPRLWKTMRTLRRARADVYIAGGAGVGTGWAYDAARLFGAHFVFLASSDLDAFPSLPALPTRREKWWYLRALRGADARVAQTELQRRLFQDNLAVDAHVIPNPVETPAITADAGANDVVLWLSTYKPIKRPEWFLELARRLPQLRFMMVGFPPSAEANESWRAAKEAAANLSNLEVHGFVRHSHVSEFLRAAALFVHTSPSEGFPNTLLEAWSYGIPCVTTVDPGGVVERYGLGEVVDSVETLVETVAGTMAAPDRRRRLGGRARRYVERHHGPDRAFEPLATLLDDVIGGADEQHG
jgi:glycosyltransferase involved in cell wall biosynthesis